MLGNRCIWLILLCACAVVGVAGISREFTWSLLWPIALIAAVRIFREASFARWRPLALGVFAVIACYTALYAFSAWPNLPWHMLTSLPRLLLPPAMIAVVLVALALPFAPAGSR